MPSPFPGMDPYLEDPRIWPDFHQTFINYWREAILDRLPPSYDARIDERLTLVELSRSTPEKSFRPDIAVARNVPRHSEHAATAGGGAAVMIEPVTLLLPRYTEIRETRIQILRGPEWELVAVLELLSPANKTGRGREQYLTKRDAILQKDIHLVELDLLLDGEHPPLDDPIPAGDYFAFVSRGDRRPKCDVYAWSVRGRLPGIPIPLQAPDPDIIIDLAEVFATTYQRGRYFRAIDYGKPPSASIPESDRQRVAERAASAAQVG